MIHLLRAALLGFLLILMTLSSSGCIGAALLGAGGRELDDHGDNARYENKSYGEHFVDELFEDDDDDDCHCHTVTVCHHG